MVNETAQLKYMCVCMVSDSLSLSPSFSLYPLSDHPPQLAVLLTVNELAAVSAHMQEWMSIGTQLQLSDQELVGIKVRIYKLYFNMQGRPFSLLRSITGSSTIWYRLCIQSLSGNLLWSNPRVRWVCCCLGLGDSHPGASSVTWLRLHAWSPGANLCFVLYLCVPLVCYRGLSGPTQTSVFTCSLRGPRWIVVLSPIKEHS